jgi:UDP-N-acetylglucosamine 2-epimerase (non-hydrolysing)
MREVLDAYRAGYEGSDVLQRLGLNPRGFLVVSAHREENVDSPTRLRQLLQGVTAVHEATDLPVFVSTHPRTRKRLEALNDWHPEKWITFSEPLGFNDYVRLQLESACVLSDSGTIAEESSMLGFSAVTLRDSIERPEALDTGAIIMTGLNADDIVTAVRLAIDSLHPDRSTVVPDDYKITNTSERVVRFILSTARRYHGWAGIRD